MNTKYIKIQMIKKDISVIDMSKMLDVNVNTLSRWLNGHNLGNIEKFIDLLVYLDIDIKKLK